MLRFKSTAFALIAAVITAAAAPTNAAPINYGDFSDIPPGSVMYLDVTESSGTDAVPLFGAPTINGNSLDFNPLGFVAFAGSGGSDLTDGQLNFMMASVPGFGIQNLFIAEAGDYSLFGTGSTATKISAGVSARVLIHEVDGTPLATPISITASSTFSSDLGSAPGTLQAWGNGLFVDFGPAMLNAGLTPRLGATRIEVVIDDLLIAISEPQSTALVAKKDFRITAGVNEDPIPEPASLTLLGLGAACLIRRR